MTYGVGSFQPPYLLTRHPRPAIDGMADRDRKKGPPRLRATFSPKPQWELKFWIWCPLVSNDGECLRETDPRLQLDLAVSLFYGRYRLQSRVPLPATSRREALHFTQ